MTSESQGLRFAIPYQSELIQLDVPYEFQLNSEVPGEGYRMCFSSTCAMAAAFLKPDSFRAGDGQRDDQWLRVVNRFGDTTSQLAQIAALHEKGIHATFRTDGSPPALIAKLKAGRPVPVGWLHRGTPSRPAGGGHWSLVVGWVPSTGHLIFHDPNGEADMVNGGYVSNAPSAGKFVRYSVINWSRRWMVEGAGTGWWIDL